MSFDKVLYKCNCRIVNFAEASLIYQPWMRSKKYIPSTLRQCGKVYYCYVDDKVYDARKQKAVASK